NWTIRKRLPRCKMRLKKRLLAFSRRLHARIRKTRYMHKMRCLLINRRSLLLALRLLWKTPIFPSNSRFPRLCAKCLRSEERRVGKECRFLGEPEKIEKKQQVDDSRVLRATMMVLVKDDDCN